MKQNSSLFFVFLFSLVLLFTALPSNAAEKDKSGATSSDAVQKGFSMGLAVGSPAPDFTLIDDGMKPFHLQEELKKGPVVVTSYLFDFTGG